MFIYGKFFKTKKNFIGGAHPRTPALHPDGVNSTDFLHAVRFNDFQEY